MVQTKTVLPHATGKGSSQQFVFGDRFPLYAVFHSTFHTCKGNEREPEHHIFHSIMNIQKVKKITKLSKNADIHVTNKSGNHSQGKVRLKGTLPAKKRSLLSIEIQDSTVFRLFNANKSRQKKILLVCHALSSHFTLTPHSDRRERPSNTCRLFRDTTFNRRNYTRATSAIATTLEGDGRNRSED